MPSTPFRERVLEVIVDLGEGAVPRFRYGSGCHVAGLTVITAAHVVVGAVQVSVRGPDKVELGAQVEDDFIGDPQAPDTGHYPDLALIRIVEGRSPIEPLPIAAVGRNGLNPEILRQCQAVGYPQFAERGGARSVRDTRHVRGYIPLLSNLVTGLLAFHVTSSPRELPSDGQSFEDSPWSGMSGAPVVSRGYLIGVVTEHARRAGASEIAVTALASIGDKSIDSPDGTGFLNSDDWWERLGLSAGLKQVARLQPGGNTRAAYWATIDDIKALRGPLIGREVQLASLMEFVSGPPGYCSLVGEAWSGKSSILAELVTATTPDDVDVVAYFLSRRSADADALRFLEAVIPQLAVIVGENPTEAFTVHYFRHLWDLAVTTSSSAGRRLLLVVDGLDEDLRPSGAPSVSSILPTLVRQHAHVLVSSRLHPDLPSDVSAAHPLRFSQVKYLEPFEGAQALAIRAWQELDHLKRRDIDDLALDVLGVLTAAAGPLAVEDLAVLTALPSPPTPAHTARVRRLVNEDAGRSLEKLASGKNSRFQFAHLSLLEQAQSDEDLGHPEYLNRIHSWAALWRDQGWLRAERSKIVNAPEYLLSDYISILSGDESLRELICSDVRWVLTAVKVVGVDHVLSQLELVVSMDIVSSRVRRLRRLVRAQAHHLRDSRARSDEMYSARQLCLYALECDEQALGDELRSVVRSGAAPVSVPLWTTRRNLSRNIDFELARNVGAIAILSDGRIVTAQDDGYRTNIRVWDPKGFGASGLDVALVNWKVSGLTALEEDKLIVHCAGGPLLMWHVDQSNSVPVELGYPLADRLIIGGSSADRVFSYGTDGRRSGVRVWRTNRDEEGRSPWWQTPSYLGSGSVRGVTAVVALPSQKFVLATSDAETNRLYLFDPGDSNDEYTLVGSCDGEIKAMAALPDGRFVTYSYNGYSGNVALWDPGNRVKRPICIGHCGHRITALAVLGDGRIVTGGGRDSGGALDVWDLSGIDAATQRVGVHPAGIAQIVSLPDGRVLTRGAGEFRHALVWDLDVLRSSESNFDGSASERVTAAAVLPDGRIVVSVPNQDHGGRLLLWDAVGPISGGTQLGLTKSVVVKIIVFPDGRIATCEHESNGGALCVWDPFSDSGRRILIEGRYLHYETYADGVDRIVTGYIEFDPHTYGLPGWVERKVIDLEPLHGRRSEIFGEMRAASESEQWQPSIDKTWLSLRREKHESLVETMLICAEVHQFLGFRGMGASKEFVVLHSFNYALSGWSTE